MTAFELENDNIKQVDRADFLAKPIKLEHLRECIIRILETPKTN